MARPPPRPRPTATQTRAPLRPHGPTCGNALWAASHHYRTITTLTAVQRLTRNMRHCIPPVWPPCRHPAWPEAEGRLALPTHEFGRDGVRPLDRQREPRPEPDAEVLRGYCSAGRRALPAAGRRRAHAARSSHGALPASGAGHKTGAVPTPRVRLHTLLPRGVPEPASRGPAGRVASRGGPRAAHVLPNADHHPGGGVKRRRRGVRGAMRQHRAAAGALAPARVHGLPVSRRDWPGLFHCEALPALPRTNHDLAQRCGAPRDHERRTTGRQGASPALVRRGAVQRLAAMATRLPLVAAWELAPEDGSDGETLRHARDTRRQQRPLRRRVRRDPDSSLAQRETTLRTLTLPP
jgi:hypothetical protein